MRTTLQQLVVSGDCVVQLGHFRVENLFYNRVSHTSAQNDRFARAQDLDKSLSFSWLPHFCRNETQMGGTASGGLDRRISALSGRWGRWAVRVRTARGWQSVCGANSPGDNMNLTSTWR